MAGVRNVIVGALLLLGGCDSEPATVASPRPQASPQPSPQPSPEPPSPVEEAEECTDATITGEVEATLRQSDNVFSPDCLIVLGGQSLKVQNRGTALHNFTVEGTQVDLDVRPGETNRTEAIGTAVEAGSYAFFCKYHRSLGMEGEITITVAG